jgi:hypothetical protein
MEAAASILAGFFLLSLDFTYVLRFIPWPCKFAGDKTLFSRKHVFYAQETSYKDRYLNVALAF